MYVVLVLLFKASSTRSPSWRRFRCRSAAPFFLLLVTGKSLSMPALIGIIMLTGIATKAILRCFTPSWPSTRG